jgi:predicted nucleic acid-binding protein
MTDMTALEQEIIDKINQFDPQAKHLMKTLQTEQVKFIAPHLLMYELMSTIRKRVYQGRVLPDDAMRIRDRLINLLYFDQSLLKRAYDIATELNRVRAYDTQFGALVECFACDFWTTDEKFYHIAHICYPTVCWVGMYPTT